MHRFADLNPRRESIQTRRVPEDSRQIWNGDCWRAAVALRVIEDLEIVVVDIDHGVGVIRKRPNTHRLPSEWEERLLMAGGWDTLLLQKEGELGFIDELLYQELDANREVLLRLLSINGMSPWLGCFNKQMGCLCGIHCSIIALNCQTNDSSYYLLLTELLKLVLKNNK